MKTDVSSFVIFEFITLSSENLIEINYFSEQFENH